MFFFQTCFEWFSKGLADLEMDTQTQLFQKELLKLDPSKLTDKGWCYFKRISIGIDIADADWKLSE